MLKFIRKSIVYPDYPRENDIHGKVVVSFVVQADGSISDIAVRRPVSPQLDAEAMRVVSLFPRFIPGMLRGVRVPVQYVLPIMFRLSPTDPVQSARQ
jgi:TonB family protein